MCRAVGRRLIARRSARLDRQHLVDRRAGRSAHGQRQLRSVQGRGRRADPHAGRRVGGHNIRVNAIAPTHFRTPLVQQAIDEDPSRLDYFLGNIPLGRLGQAERRRRRRRVPAHLGVGDGHRTRAERRRRPFHRLSVARRLTPIAAGDTIHCRNRLRLMVSNQPTRNIEFARTARTAAGEERGNGLRGPGTK